MAASPASSSPTLLPHCFLDIVLCGPLGPTRTKCGGTSYGHETTTTIEAFIGLCSTVVNGQMPLSYPRKYPRGDHHTGNGLTLGDEISPPFHANPRS
ncbi:hypothetical protein PR003_g18932 [Phytophthora rubi]|uniref:Uncharacterized protein n=2 Tax=Phytophthora TaxID=4783 RepID=A0A6A4E1W4_9STRA|nr:hypothetical protein PR001_g23522 [Phytophthora rubi]KAE9315653.1 hypothetical protein PR003_g18932 [Phytophthora rubi]KAE9338500.1 hypothetical protein PF008_g12035 [Phytophthora fragariae]